jgi:hypothetical protein
MAVGPQAKRAGRVKRIVCDTGPLLHLLEANLLNLPRPSLPARAGASAGLAGEKP